MSKAFHRDSGPCWLHCFPQLCRVGWMSFGWWTILDTHRKLLTIKKNSSVAVLDTNQCAWYLLPSPVQRHIHILSCPFTLWMAHIDNPCLNCLKAQKKSFFNLSPPFHPHWLKWIEQVTSIRDHSFHLDSPGQSVMERVPIVPNVLSTRGNIISTVYPLWRWPQEENNPAATGKVNYCVVIIMDIFVEWKWLTF